jgi:hypothetical protein
MCGEVERTPHDVGGSPAGKKKKMHEIVEVGRGVGGVGEDVHHGIDGKCVCASFAGIGESGKWVREEGVVGPARSSGRISR